MPYYEKDIEEATRKRAQATKALFELQDVLDRMAKRTSKGSDTDRQLRPDNMTTAGSEGPNVEDRAYYKDAGSIALPIHNKDILSKEKENVLDWLDAKARIHGTASPKEFVLSRDSWELYKEYDSFCRRNGRRRIGVAPFEEAICKKYGLCIASLQYAPHDRSHPVFAVIEGERPR